MREVLAVVALVLVVLAGLWASALVVERNAARAEAEKQTGVAVKATARAAGFESSLGQCTSAAAEQSRAVLALKADRDRLQQVQDANRKKAALDAKPSFDRAAGLGALKPPAGGDACAWARDLVDQELRLERGK